MCVPEVQDRVGDGRCALVKGLDNETKALGVGADQSGKVGHQDQGRKLVHVAQLESLHPAKGGKKQEENREENKDKTRRKEMPQEKIQDMKKNNNKTRIKKCHKKKQRKKRKLKRKK